MGNTKVLAIVCVLFLLFLSCSYGPQNACEDEKVDEDKATVTANVTITPFCGIDHKVISSNSKTCSEIRLAIRRCFEQIILTSLFPRSIISIHCTVIQSDGGELPCCLNAALLAVIDAGLPILDFQIALEVGYMDNTVLLGKLSGICLTL